MLSKNYINKISEVSNAKIFVPKQSNFDKSIFKNLNCDRAVFGFYFKLFSLYASSQEGFFSDIELYKKLLKIDKKINFKQFIFCLYVFVELGIFSLENELELLTLKENKKVVSALTNSNFYNAVKKFLEK